MLLYNIARYTKDIQTLQKSTERVDVYLISTLSPMSNLLIPFAQQVKKPPMLMLPLQTIMPTALLSRVLETYVLRNWEDTLSFFKVLRVRKILDSVQKRH